MFETFFKGVDGIEIVETDSKKIKMKKVYMILNLLQK